jgi:hypothetical protein
MDIWRAVQQPYDSVEPPAGAVTNPAMLKVNVIDPAVISVNWSVDGNMVAPERRSDVRGRSAGPDARLAHDHRARLRQRGHGPREAGARGRPSTASTWGSGAMGPLDKTVTWTVTIQ